jgi:hypothetical protein
MPRQEIRKQASFKLREPVKLKVDGHDGSSACLRLFNDVDQELNEINRCEVDSDCKMIFACDAANKNMSTQKIEQLLEHGESICKWMVGLCMYAYVQCDRGRCVPSRGDAGVRIKSQFLYDPEEDDLVRKRD